jgi:hypothetical protein
MASAPLDTSERCDASLPNARRLSNTHCIVRAGRPTNGTSVTGRSSHRFTVTMGDDSSAEARATISAIDAGAGSSARARACQGTAQMTAGASADSSRHATWDTRPASQTTRAGAFACTWLPRAASHAAAGLA